MSDQHNMRTGKPQFSTREIKSDSTLSTIVHKIGHEIGNPLTSIISLSTILAMPMGSAVASDKTITYAESITSEAWRISALTERFVLLLSDRTGNIAPAEITETLKKSLNKLRRKSGFPDADVIVRCGEPHVCAMMDSEQLMWLLSALLENALQSELRENDVDSLPPIAVHIRKEQQHCIVEIVNYKHAACEFELDRLFEPFVTEFADQKRLGLGLTVCWSILERIKAEIELFEEEENNLYKFTSRLTLPAA